MGCRSLDLESPFFELETPANSSIDKIRNMMNFCFSSRTYVMDELI